MPRAGRTSASRRTSWGRREAPRPPELGVPGTTTALRRWAHRRGHSERPSWMDRYARSALPPEGHIHTRTVPTRDIQQGTVPLYMPHTAAVQHPYARAANVGPLPPHSSAPSLCAAPPSEWQRLQARRCSWPETVCGQRPGTLVEWKRSPSQHPAGNMRNALVSYRIVSYRIARYPDSVVRTSLGLQSSSPRAVPIKITLSWAVSRAKKALCPCRPASKQESKQRQCVRAYDSAQCTADGPPPFPLERAAPTPSARSGQEPRAKSPPGRIKRLGARNQKHTQRERRPLRGSPIGAREAHRWVPECPASNDVTSGGVNDPGRAGRRFLVFIALM